MIAALPPVVAFTVIVACVLDVPDWFVLLQELSAAANTNTPIIPGIHNLRCNRRERPRPQKIIPTHGSSKPYAQSGVKRSGGRKAALAAVVLTVSVVVAAVLPLGVTDAGLKLHVTPDGNALQEKLTCESNPFSGVTVRVEFALCPAAMVREVELAEN